MAKPQQAQVKSQRAMSSSHRTRKALTAEIQGSLLNHSQREQRRRPVLNVRWITRCYKGNLNLPGQLGVAWPASSHRPVSQHVSSAIGEPLRSRAVASKGMAIGRLPVAGREARKSRKPVSRKSTSMQRSRQPAKLSVSQVARSLSTSPSFSTKGSFLGTRGRPSLAKTLAAV